MSRSSARIYNVVSMTFLALSLAWVVVVVILLAS